MRVRTLLSVVSLGALVLPFGGAAVAAPDKVRVCHVDSEGQLKALDVAGKALSAHLGHGDGQPGDAAPGLAGHIFDSECVPNAIPVVDDQTFNVDEDSPNGTAVGTILFNDPDSDPVALSVTGGTGASAFDVDGNSGAVTVADETQLDFDTTPSFTLAVQVTDARGAGDTAVVTIDLNEVLDCITNEAELKTAAATGGSYCVDASAPILLTSEVDVTTALALTSTGPGNAVIDANQTGRVFTVTADLTLDDITITGGAPSNPGGGINVTAAATVTLDGASSITGNTANAGAGIFTNQVFPGVIEIILNDEASISDNDAVTSLNLSTAGGGVYLAAATLRMFDNSHISDNFVQGPAAKGGGVLNNSGHIFMQDNASIDGNDVGDASGFASRGGGIYHTNNATITLAGNATIRENSAIDDGGGIYRFDSGLGTITGVTSSNVILNSPNNCSGAPFPGNTVPGCVG